MNKFTKALAAAVVGALLSGVSAPNAAAFSGAENYALVDMGTCQVRIQFGTGTADVTMNTPGNPTSGAALFSAGKLIPFRGIAASDVQGCGFSDVTNLQQNGADGTWATDSYVGFSFEGTFAGAHGRYEYALKGAANTAPLMSVQFSTPGWKACAKEGETCKVGSATEVRYGASGKFITRTQAADFPCTNAHFGSDPVPNVVKTCEVRSHEVRLPFTFKR